MSTHQILFIDSVCPRPYDGNTLESSPQGGTESTVTRLAEALARRGHRVRVAQENRHARADIGGVEYTPFDAVGDFGPTRVVALRTCLLLDQVSARWPAARSFVWYHDSPRDHLFRADVEALVRNRGTAILLSDWHVRRWVDYLHHFRYAGDATRVVRLYNPIPDDLRPDDTPVDPDKFVFLSIPDKGLRETLDCFARFQHYPQLRNARLYVASPGYRQVDVEIPPGRVVQLGSLPWKRAIRELRGAFMVLDYNTETPETFGLVHAEADAVGTPWIGAYHGANPEVRSHPDELMDLADPEAVIERIIHWREHGRIRVGAREEFRMSNVVTRWETLFDEEG